MKDWTEAGEEKNCRPLTLGSRVGSPTSRGPGSEKRGQEKFEFLERNRQQKFRQFKPP